MEKRKVPVKNYLLFALLTVVTVMIVFYLGKWYRTTNDLKSEKSLILSVISEVKLGELDNYLLENPNGLLFISSGSDQTVKSYEEELKAIITEYDLRDEILYLDQDSLKTEKKQDDFVKKYFYEDMKNVRFETPNLLLFQNGKVVALLKIGNTTLAKEETMKFLKEHGVID